MTYRALLEREPDGHSFMKRTGKHTNGGASGRRKSVAELLRSAYMRFAVDTETLIALKAVLGLGRSISSVGAEFHIFALEGDLLFELEMPGEDCRIEFLSIVEAARHARAHPAGKGGTAVIHDHASNLLNRIPLWGVQSRAVQCV
jgi:hypothetical protein